MKHSEFIDNVLYYIAGYIVSKLTDECSCTACKGSVLSVPGESLINGQVCTASLKASSFTAFVSKGGLKISSESVFRTVEFCEKVFKITVTGKDGKHISNEGNLKKNMIVAVCHHFLVDPASEVFKDHEDGNNEALVEVDHRMKLMKCVADKYFTLRLYNFGKRCTREIPNNGKQSDRHRLTLFSNQ